jgi:hypothetical protein
MAKIIKWAFSVRSDDWIDSGAAAWADQIERIVEIPSPLSRDVISTRKNIVFLKCPAHTDFIKNMFVFKSPTDITIDIDISEQYARVECPNIDQNIFNNFIDVRFLGANECGISPYPLIGIDFLNVFTSHDSVIMSAMPAFFHHNDFTKKTSFIPGEFDIGKWTRPIECVFEVKNSKETIEIKKGDALFYVKFNVGSEVIKLEKQDMPWEDIFTCVKLRRENIFKSLKFRYDSLLNFKKINNG